MLIISQQFVSRLKGSHASLQFSTKAGKSFTKIDVNVDSSPRKIAPVRNGKTLVNPATQIGKSRELSLSTPAVTVTTYGGINIFTSATPFRKQEALIVDAAPLLWLFAYRGVTDIDKMIIEVNRWCKYIVQKRSPQWAALVLDSPGSKQQKQAIIDDYRVEANNRKIKEPETIKPQMAQPAASTSSKTKKPSLLPINEQREQEDQLDFKYKGNRVATALNDVIKETILRLKGMDHGDSAMTIIDYPETEADDVIATLTGKALQFSDSSTVAIVSPDKDFFQLLDASNRVRLLRKFHHSKLLDEEGTTHIWFKENFGIESTKFIDYLALLGDAIDNVPGVRGCGKVRALKLIQQFGSLDGALAAAAENRIPGSLGLELAKSKDVALLSRELVRLNSNLDLKIPTGFSSWSDALRPKIVS